MTSPTVNPTTLRKYAGAALVGALLAAPGAAGAQPAEEPPEGDEPSEAEAPGEEQPEEGPPGAVQPETGEEGPAEEPPEDEPLLGPEPEPPAEETAPETADNERAPDEAEETERPREDEAGETERPDEDASAEEGAEGSVLAEGQQERPTGEQMGMPTSEVYAEDWWNLSRPTFEIHGYYRVRTNFRSHFALGRKDAKKPLWPQPPENDYIDTQGNPHDVVLCGDDPDNLEPCDNNTQAGANMRFRLNPELHISDNLRVRAQIDMLDNVVLGSTPEGYANTPAEGGGYRVVARGGFAPLGAFSSTQWAPQSGVNSTRDSVVVKRAWGEYSTPIGQLRFGRMPSHWGLGMFVNAGDGYDSDWQSTADRLMFITGIRDWDLYFAAAWDFANEGPTSSNFNELQGQPYDLAQKDDVDQWVFVIVRRMREALAEAALADGDPVFEGGTYFVYRQQELAQDTTDPAEDASLGATSDEISDGLVRRGAQAFIPDAWFRFRWHSFRFEAEAAMIWGSLENTLRSGQSNYSNSRNPDEDGWNIRQFGVATESEFLALDDQLRIGFKFGYATGDDDVESLRPVGNELQPQLTLDRTYSTFRFHPNYRVDLIFWRNIMTRVQGAYYFRPSVGYDFIRDPDGQKVGGDAAVIWSRASEFVQTPGHARDLGVELNFKVHYQAKDGVLNDDPDRMGGFYTSLEYGVLFPLDGLDYLPGQVEDYAAFTDAPLETETAQAVRWFIGILF